MKPTQRQCIIAALLSKGYTLQQSFTHADEYSKTDAIANIYVGLHGSIRVGVKVSYTHQMRAIHKQGLIEAGRAILQSKIC
jgi:hypothetical protein